MTLAAAAAHIDDTLDWARPFQFGTCLWSLPPPSADANNTSQEGIDDYGIFGAGAASSSDGVNTTTTSATTTTSSAVPRSMEFCDQAKLYDAMGSGLVDSVFAGIHATMFAVGEAGGGKTHSMMGPDPLAMHLTDLVAREELGVIPRALLEILHRASAVAARAEKFKRRQQKGARLSPSEFSDIEEEEEEEEEEKDYGDDDSTNGGGGGSVNNLEELEEAVLQVSGGVREVSLRLSILEVYNDNLRDLLSPNPDDPKQA
jgi:hypothetical protein